MCATGGRLRYRSGVAIRQIHGTCFDDYASIVFDGTSLHWSGRTSALLPLRAARVVELTDVTTLALVPRRAIGWNHALGMCCAFGAAIMRSYWIAGIAAAATLGSAAYRWRWPPHALVVCSGDETFALLVDRGSMADARALVADHGRAAAALPAARTYRHVPEDPGPTR